VNYINGKNKSNPQPYDIKVIFSTLSLNDFNYYHSHELYRYNFAHEYYIVKVSSYIFLIVQKIKLQLLQNIENVLFMIQLINNLILNLSEKKYSII